MIETPRYDTLMFRILGRRERSLSCEGHVYFFTNSSLRTCYEAAGFRLVEHRCVGRSLTLNRLAYNLGVMSKSPRFQHMADAVTRWLRLNRMSVYLNMRDMQRVCVQKVPEVIPRSSAKAASLPGKAPQVRVDADGDEIMTVAP
jgi:hypothetical protein